MIVSVNPWPVQAYTYNIVYNQNSKVDVRPDVNFLEPASHRGTRNQSWGMPRGRGCSLSTSGCALRLARHCSAKWRLAFGHYRNQLPRPILIYTQFSRLHGIPPLHRHTVPCPPHLPSLSNPPFPPTHWDISRYLSALTTTRPHFSGICPNQNQSSSILTHRLRSKQLLPIVPLAVKGEAENLVSAAKLSSIYRPIAKRRKRYPQKWLSAKISHLTVHYQL